MCIKIIKLRKTQFLAPYNLSLVLERISACTFRKHIGSVMADVPLSGSLGEPFKVCSNCNNAKFYFCSSITTVSDSWRLFGISRDGPILLGISGNHQIFMIPFFSHFTKWKNYARLVRKGNVKEEVLIVSWHEWKCLHSWLVFSKEFASVKWSLFLLQKAPSIRSFWASFLMKWMEVAPSSQDSAKKISFKSTAEGISLYSIYAACCKGNKL